MTPPGLASFLKLRSDLANKKITSRNSTAASSATSSAEGIELPVHPKKERRGFESLNGPLPICQYDFIVMDAFKKTQFQRLTDRFRP